MSESNLGMMIMCVSTIRLLNDNAIHSVMYIFGGFKSLGCVMSRDNVAFTE